MTTVDELRASIRRLPANQQTRFSKRLAGMRRVEEPARRARILAKIAADVEAVQRRRELRAASIPDRLVYPDLPITARRDELLETIRDNQVVIVAGETGSGKSTVTDLVARFYQNAGELETLYGLLIVKNGYLIAEDYFNGSSAGENLNSHSATNGITSGLVCAAFSTKS